MRALHDEGAYHFLEQQSDEVAQLSREVAIPLLLIAESDRSDPRTILGTAQGGMGMNAHWCHDLHHAIHVLLTCEKRGYHADYGQVSQVERATNQGFGFRNECSIHRRRRHGHPWARVPRDRPFVAPQNHDQVGDRAHGERIGHLLDLEQLKLATDLALWSGSVLLIFQGEEWNASSPFRDFTSHGDPEPGRRIADGSRREFPTFGRESDDIADPQDPETFRRSTLRWEEVCQPPHIAVLNWYCLLIRKRRERQAACREKGKPVNHVESGFDSSGRLVSLRRGNIEVHANLVAGHATFDGLSLLRWMLCSTCARFGASQITEHGTQQTISAY